MSKAKVNLDLLKKLVGELESSLQNSEAVKSDNNEYVVELSKAAGLAAGVMQEASLLVLDIHALTQLSPGKSKESVASIIDTLKALKPGGSN